MKRILSIVLVLVLLCTVIPVSGVSAAGDVQYASAYRVNPLYSHEEAPTLNHQAEKLEATNFRTTLSAVAADFRDAMETRAATIVLGYAMPGTTHTRNDIIESSNELFDEAIKHTGVPTEGDYLMWQYKSWNANMSWEFRSGKTYVTYTYTMKYYTTAAQEAQVTAAVASLITSLGVRTATDYQKVRAVYDYMCSNIVYDHTGLNLGDDLAHTAYAALIKNKAVCQGYAALFYRLALELGVDARLIAGIGAGGPHGWNIVKLGSRYYNLDSTWDAEYSQAGLDYEYFLKTESTFGDHTRYDEYDTASFHSCYPMAYVDYHQDEDTEGSIPTCDLSVSKFQVTFSNSTPEMWLTYRPTASGDYTLHFSDLHAYVSIFEVESGKLIYEEVDTEYGLFSDLKNGLVFSLKANTDYYVYIKAYRAATVTLSMTRNAKAVKTIAADRSLYDITCYWDINRIDGTCFTYKITYTDGSSMIVNSSEEVERMGYLLPTITYKGVVDTINYSTYLRPGYQPVVSTYNGYTVTTNVYVKSLTEYYSYLTPVGAEDICGIEYESDEPYTYLWRVRMSEPGYYGVYRNNTDNFVTNFKYYSFELIDEKNNIVPFNSEKLAFPVEANKDYILSFRYHYKPEYSYNDIDFWFEKVAAMPKGWALINGKWYFFENNRMVKAAWRKDSIGWVYLGQDGAMLTNSWCTDSQGWCYVGANGYAVTNCWKKDSIGWIWLNANGSMTKNSWLKDGGKWYYLDGNGYMLANTWKKDSVGWVYLGSSGAMLTNSWCTDSQGWCYVGANGYAVTNCWKKDSIGWIWLNANGSMTKNSWLQDGGKWYYLDGNGYMLSNTSLKYKGITYYFNASGVCINP